jgi:hypothetical protein
MECVNSIPADENHIATSAPHVGNLMCVPLMPECYGQHLLVALYAFWFGVPFCLSDSGHYWISGTFWDDSGRFGTIRDTTGCSGRFGTIRDDSGHYWMFGAIRDTRLYLWMLWRRV